MTGSIIKTGKEKNRTCLKCNNEFYSSGPSNRICYECSKENSLVKLNIKQTKGHDNHVVRKSTNLHN